MTRRLENRKGELLIENTRALSIPKGKKGTEKLTISKLYGHLIRTASENSYFLGEKFDIKGEKFNNHDGKCSL